jgi:hypothetical protein
MNGMMTTLAVGSGLFVGLALMVAVIGLTLNMAQQQLLDAQNKVTRALPASTVAVTSLNFDTQQATTQSFDAGQYELEIVAPLVTTAQLPDTKTFTYKLIHSANSDLSSPSDLALSLIVQTGAGGAGAAAATARYRLPGDHKRYIGLVITPSASGTGDASAATATLQARF